MGYLVRFTLILVLGSYVVFPVKAVDFFKEDDAYYESIASEFEMNSYKIPILKGSKNKKDLNDEKHKLLWMPRLTKVSSVAERMSLQEPAGEVYHRDISDASLAKDKLKILSIDGGGIRGILPLFFLAKLEAMTGKRTYEMFDVIAGTSTGGMIAMALSVASAQEVLDLYMDYGEKIFMRNYKPYGPKYSSKNRRAIFKNFFGERKLSEAKVPTIVTAWELNRDKAYHLYSKWPVEHIFSHEHLDMLMSDVALATSAAPTFFEAETVHPVHVNGVCSEDTFTFIDGGVFANNPSMIALTYAMTLYPNVERNKIDLLSLGTGYHSMNLNGVKTKFWTRLRWLPPLMHILLMGNGKSVDEELKRLMQRHYDRVSTRLQHADYKLDRVGKNLRNLRLDAEIMVDENSHILERWAKKGMGMKWGNMNESRQFDCDELILTKR